MFLAILRLPRVELHCKLQEKLRRMTGPLLSVYIHSGQTEKYAWPRRESNLRHL